MTTKAGVCPCPHFFSFFCCLYLRLEVDLKRGKMRTIFELFDERVSFFLVKHYKDMGIMNDDDFGGDFDDDSDDEDPDNPKEHKVVI